LPPAGELGILKNVRSPEAKVQLPSFATLLDYLPRETIFLLCEPESLAVHADEYDNNSKGRSVLHFLAGFSGGAEPARCHLVFN
jgi:hypothetical protein